MSTVVYTISRVSRTTHFTPIQAGQITDNALPGGLCEALLVRVGVQHGH